MTSQLETDESIRSAIGAKAIALKLIEHSENATMFTRIYPDKPAPTVHLISHLGVLLASFSDTLDKESFIGKLNESSDVVSPAVQAPVTAPVATSASAASPSASGSQSPQADDRTIEEKKNAMLERIKENREKNKKHDEERAKNQEVERIRAGERHSEPEILVDPGRF